LTVIRAASPGSAVVSLPSFSRSAFASGFEKVVSRTRACG
jgi:hypothetical protein